uniref:Glycosyltransferase 2-like domain-containing protein n=1 Tax=viral metagenome TaxID=1070528 RepID=A0A6C0IFT5_9ZZZZ
MELIESTNTSPTLCLNMIVKNESKIITRLLESVLSVIDCYCICDTGSTDNTVELIQDFFSKKNINGKIVNEPFKNFAHNRNFALKSCLGMSDYVLFLDADMIIKVNNFDKKSLLQNDYFYILQGNDNFYYQNTRIIKNNGLFNYVGVTHEYISAPHNSKSAHIEKDKIFIIDIGDGGSKNDKYERDIRLLTDAIVLEPKNERYNFYLANSYHDSGKFEEAIKTYQKRIELGGWDQEVWYSYYRIGLCYKSLSKMEQAICAWMNGYNFSQIRVENLYEIIHYYRNTSKHKLAEIFYNIARNVLSKNINRDSFLFLHNDVYTHKIDYEYTIFAFYNNVKNINEEIIKILNNSNDISIYSNLFSNMKFYKQVLSASKKFNFSNSTKINVNNEIINFNSSSSSLIKSKNNGYIMNIRYVNYVINNDGCYLNCEKNIITYNKYIELDNNFIVTNEKMFESIYDGRRYIGTEDVRIFNDSETDDLLFIGTGYHSNNKVGVVNGKYDTNKNILEYNEIKSSFSKNDCEKNWVYVDYKKSSHVIYNWHPLHICKINPETNLLDLIETKEMPLIFSHARGSTCGYKYTKYRVLNDDQISLNIEETEIWFILHLNSYEQLRQYYHMFAIFDASLNLLRYSAPFKFDGAPIEYCLSLVVEDDSVLINYSNWDRTTTIGVYDKKYIDSLIKY